MTDKNDRHDSAEDFERLKKCYDDLNEVVRARQYETQIMDEDGSIHPNQVLDILHGTKELEAFQKEYPDVDYTVIVRSNQTDVDFKRALGEMSKLDGLQEERDAADLMSEQDGLKAGMLEKLEDDQMKILDFTDEQADKLEQILGEGVDPGILNKNNT